MKNNNTLSNRQSSGWPLGKEKEVFWSHKNVSLAHHYFNPLHPNPGRREEINLNFYFLTSLWCLKRFYEGLYGLGKTFWGTTKKCEKKFKLIFILIQFSEMHGTRRVNLLHRENFCYHLKFHRPPPSHQIIVSFETLKILQVDK